MMKDADCISARTTMNGALTLCHGTPEGLEVLRMTGLERRLNIES